MPKIEQEVKELAKTWLTNVELDLDNLSSRLRAKWGDYYRTYRTFENQQKLPGQSDVFIPKIFEIIEKKAPMIVAEKPRFIATPRTNEANTDVGVVRDMLGFWWDEDRMKRKSEPWVKECLIYGVGQLKVGWHQEWGMKENSREEIDSETGETIAVTETEEELLFERPTAELVSIFDIKLDPRAESYQDGVGVMQYIHDIRFADLLKFDEDIYDLSEVKKMSKAEVVADGGDEKASSEAETVEQDKGVNDLSENIDKNKMTLVEFWGVFSPTGEPEDEKEYVITSIYSDGEHKHIIRCEDNDLGFRPFVKVDDRVIRGEFYSIGEVEPLEGLQIEYNNMRNARIDFNNSVNYPEWMYNVNADINPSHLIHKPNNIIPIDVPLGTDVRSALRPVDKPIAPLSGQVEEAQMNRDFQTISQTIDFTDRGGSQGFSNTATGIKSRDRQTNSQLGNIVDHLEDAIAELGVMWLRIAEKMSEDTIEIRRERPESDQFSDVVPRSEVPNRFTQIDKSMLKNVLSNFTIRVEGGSTTADSAEGRAQDSINIMNTSAQAMALGVPVNMTKVYSDVLTDGFQKSNPEEYIKEPTPGIPGVPGQPAIPGGMESAPGGMMGGKVPMQPSLPSNLG